MNYKEKKFEQDIETFMLNQGGYTKGDLSTYNRKEAIDLPKLIDFIKNTQPKEWDRYQAIYKDSTESALLKRFNNVVERQGLLDVLRNGFEDRGVKLKVCCFKPESTLNQNLLDNYNSNILSVTRQFKYSVKNENSIDMVISLNGIPIVAMELKNQPTEQTVYDAKIQFMNDRDPKEKCFNFNNRFLVYFALDHYDVAMTTELKGRKTQFLPFNQGSGGAGNVGGEGNPQNKQGYSTSYLWEQVLTKDSLLNIIQRFMHLSVKQKKEIIKNKEKTIISKKLIFPRYHQLDVVTKIVEDVKLNGSGKNYLIQHSAGSGKSNSIAWSCHRLVSLHDENNQPIFTSVIVVTDRKALDSQLQETISGFEHKLGVVETIEAGKTSQDLKKAINDGKKIIVTTLQKFPVIYKEVDENDGKRFAIIVDEAHSSQTGSSALKLKMALADCNEALREYEERERQEESKIEDFEDKFAKEMASHGHHKNLSFFAFTATPKQKTLEMFGTKQEDGTFRPFHVYSMKQAIQEGFIHDVLLNYMTYKQSCKIVKSMEGNPELLESETKKAIQRYKSLHPYSLGQKTAIIIEHFREEVMGKIGGKAKAMVVTASRLHAVRYFLEFKRYIAEKGYSDLDVLVAFSGTVGNDGKSHTESGLNSTKSGESISEEQLPEAFNSDEFSILVVAEKYQTGFDEPLLHTMYVDKKLTGVKAVQTLSRLNRTMENKEDTFVLDFVNNADDIKNAFAPYYGETQLDEEVDVNLIYDTKYMLRSFNLYDDNDISEFNNILRDKEQLENNSGIITSFFKPIADKLEKQNKDDKFKFKKGVRNFVKWYSYITHITRLFDKDLQKEYHFLKSLGNVLPGEERESENISGKIKMEEYRLQESYNGSISLNTDETSKQLENPKSIDMGRGVDDKKETLDNIIREINREFNGVSPDSDSLGSLLIEVMNRLEDDSELDKYIENNSEEDFINHVFKRKFFQTTMNVCRAQVETCNEVLNDEQLQKVIATIVGQNIYSANKSKK